MASTLESVRVIVRCRPTNERERQLDSKNIVEINSSTLQCSLISTSSGEPTRKTFTFDGVYDQTSTTEQIYNDFGYPLVEGVMEGYNATVFAYGQTGSGKSFTMQGVSSPASQLGVLPRTFDHLFEAIAADPDTKYLVFASYLEIYNEEIRDLLSPDYKRKLDLKESPDKGVYVNQLSQHPVQSVKDCQHLMESGWKNRAVGATLMNADSSRSHSIFFISVEMMDTAIDGQKHPIRRGKLNLVDLAGCERQSKTGASGDRLKEATKINLSLSALGNVISALVDGKSTHIPYRDSKLTRLLQDSLGGNTKTLMIACISPADDNYDETLSTLRYANRAKNIQNKPRINEDPKDAMLREYQKEIERLNQMVQQQKPTDIPKSEAELERERSILRSEYEEKLQQMQKDIEREQETNAKVAAEMDNLRRAYQDELQKINSESMRKKMELDQAQQETLRRLRDIEAQMVGGEKANDLAFQEKRLRRKHLHEKRRALLAQLLAQTDDENGILLRVYDNIQEEVRAKNEIIKKYKHKLRSYDKDIKDLQSEFEVERSDYLETIRRQDQHLRLLQQIIAKVQPLIRKDCNYSDLEHVKQQCVWLDELQRWKIPEVSMLRVKLPPAGANASSYYEGYETLAETEEDQSKGDRLFQKLQRSEAENLAGKYFASNRADDVVTRVNKDLNRVRQSNHRTTKSLSQSHSSLINLEKSSGLSGGLSDIQPSPSSWSAPNSFTSQSNCWLATDSTAFSKGLSRGPIRLESLTHHNADLNKKLSSIS